MTWKKLGPVYQPQGSARHPKLATHAANPLAVNLQDDVFRIFYSGRDTRNRSSVGAVDINIVKREIVKDHHEPFFEFGPPGSFYEAGVSIGNCYEANGRRYILFMGWQTPEGSHWRGDIGRLILGADWTLTLDGPGHFMGVDSLDPISLSYAWVAKSSSRFEMWYGSTTTWDAGNGEMIHVINSATSDDGNTWFKNGLALPFELNRAQAFSRPTVAVDLDGTKQMWFSYRSGTGTKYRIGYAENVGGKWQLRLDQAGIDVSPSGWDSEMIEYPFVFDHKGERYLLYNGNDFGRTGFGLAIWENST